MPREIERIYVEVRCTDGRRDMSGAWVKPERLIACRDALATVTAVILSAFEDKDYPRDPKGSEASASVSRLRSRDSSDPPGRRHLGIAAKAHTKVSVLNVLRTRDKA